jgi:sialate O-acetylesterase
MRTRLRISFVFFILFLFIQAPTYAQVTLPKVFGNNMVLQRGIKIPVWGNAAPKARIIAELGISRVSTTADKNGKWKVSFPKFKAGGPYELKISEAGKPGSEIRLKGILIGDVWLASGQSNMDWPVQQAMDAKNEIASANQPEIRFLVVEHDKKLLPQADISKGEWKVCDTSTVKNFSAVAYSFARKIRRDQNVPVGIIQSSRGGTPVEAWTSREKLLSSSITKARILANDTLSQDDFMRDSLNSVALWMNVYQPKNNADKIIPNPAYTDVNWPTVQMPGVLHSFGIGPYEGIVWMRKKIVLPKSFSGKDLTLNLGHPEMNYSLYFNGNPICKMVWNSNPSHIYTIPANLVKDGENSVVVRLAMLWGGGGLNGPAEDLYISDGVSKVSIAGKWLFKQGIELPGFPVKNYQYYPTVLFNSMINPLIPYGIKGFLWYQGEANDTAAYNYRKLFPMMISDWRERWKQGKLPFLYVQLANYKMRKELPSESEWAELREAQTMTLSQPNTAMACIIDIGEANDIHPTNKKEVGRRLALNANKLVYKQDIVASGPIYKSYRKDGNRIRISFTNIGSGISTREGAGEVTGFAIAGKDQQFQWAKATIEGHEVVVYCDKVSDPLAVRYAWADNPECNLMNSAGLPAIPFRTDDWRGITQK